MTTLDYKLDLNIPLESLQHVEYVKNSLSPDPVLKPTEIQVDFYSSKELLSDDIALIIKFQGQSDRILRVAVNNMIENLKTCIECLEVFG
ncbi:EKC/KEOPS complex subunit [Komagataella phaffii CBS 7435]|uniref:Proposed transcription factor n=2 Tax=Komagataella phaffii TaxID=460519 RepID=C4R7A5_KOMPG|nr:putative transcription factor [Komagataella phaffii GS115]CAH2451147.1 EKC/KEOPS complex subunit [Komagataella phaffii CBS 7435]CAY71480.1 Proposed transcription factor [Komagataella phaffii GS115]CCA40910.1 EKC/KEOPS complex subunit [Komagataella phaffii CBS 7435]